MEMNRKLLIPVVLLLIVVTTLSKTEPQVIAPECFEVEDCNVPVQVGYCEAQYDCVSGRCFSEQIRCPEICSGGEDEDLDNQIDCKDPDCYDSPSCPCISMSFNSCKVGRCYCSSGVPRWAIFEDGSNECQCG